MQILINSSHDNYLYTIESVINSERTKTLIICTHDRSLWMVHRRVYNFRNQYFRKLTKLILSTITYMEKQEFEFFYQIHTVICIHLSIIILFFDLVRCIGFKVFNVESYIIRMSFFMFKFIIHTSSRCCILCKYDFNAMALFSVCPGC